MAEYTQLSLQDITSIAEVYGIEEITSFSILSGGSENTNYFVQTNSYNYVFTVCEQKSISEAKQLADLLTHLNKSNFQTSKVVNRKDGQSIFVWNDKPIIVKEYIDGAIKKDLSPELLRMIGKQLAKLHKIDPPDDLPIELNYGIEQFYHVDQYAPGSAFRVWLKHIEDYITPYLKMDLPKSIIHSDLFWDNVIIGDMETSATIMDFEEATYYYRVFDIGMSIIGVCNEGQVINMTKAKYLLNGYQTETHLSKAEIDVLKPFTVYAAASMSYWRHQNFNYAKPDPEKFDHYLGLKELADFILEQEDDCFSKMIK